jgi:hypothetical protein
MQAWIIDHYDAGHICNNCANGAAGILFAILLFVFPITLSLLTKKEAPVFGAYIYFLLLLSLSGYVVNDQSSLISSAHASAYAWSGAS